MAAETNFQPLSDVKVYIGTEITFGTATLTGGTWNEYEVLDYSFPFPSASVEVAPQRAGRKACNRMIELAKEHLKTDGTFWLVGRHKFGGKMFEQKMEEVFGNVETVERESGFRIYRSRKTI